MNRIHKLLALYAIMTLQLLPAHALKITDLKGSFSILGKWNGNDVIRFKQQYFQQTDASGTLEEIILPGVSRILAVSTGNSPVALVESSGKLKLLKQFRSKFWTSLKLPDTKFVGQVQLWAFGDAVLIGNNNSYYYFDKKWKLVSPEKPGKECASLVDSRKGTASFLFKPPYIYKGMDCGEFGGGLVRLNLDSGKWERVSEVGNTVVTDLSMDGSDIKVGIRRRHYNPELGTGFKIDSANVHRTGVSKR